MKKHYKKIGAFVLIALLVGGCARGCESLEREFQTSDRQYHIKQYSGGVLIKEWNFIGILNNQDASDGYYFTVNDTLYEIGGDLIISSTK